jgi:two-component system, chemotaxis family, response regulator Rcp1
VYSRDLLTTPNIAAQESAWRSVSASWNVMAEESGSSPNPEEEQLPSSLSREKPSSASQQRFVLLLAEDNFPDALVVRDAIQQENLPLDVHVASDGEEAMDFLTRAETDPDARSPDVVLLDLNLPKRDGFEILQRLRGSEKLKSVPVVVVTSSDAPSDKRCAAQLGAGYFQKPPSYDAFLKIGAVLKQILTDTGALSS